MRNANVEMKECILTPQSSPLEVHILFVVSVCMLSANNVISHFFHFSFLIWNFILHQKKEIP